jgi:hypothetical protein
MAAPERLTRRGYAPLGTPRRCLRPLEWLTGLFRKLPPSRFAEFSRQYDRRQAQGFIRANRRRFPCLTSAFCYPLAAGAALAFAKKYSPPHCCLKPRKHAPERLCLRGAPSRLFQPPAMGGKIAKRSPSFRSWSGLAWIPFRKMILGSSVAMFRQSRTSLIAVPSGISMAQEFRSDFSGRREESDA